MRQNESGGEKQRTRQHRIHVHNRESAKQRTRQHRIIHVHNRENAHEVWMVSLTKQSGNVQRGGIWCNGGKARFRAKRQTRASQRKEKRQAE